MFTVADLFMILMPGTVVTIQDNRGYQILNEPIEDICDANPVRERVVKSVSPGYKAIHIYLESKEG